MGGGEFRVLLLHHLPPSMASFRAVAAASHGAHSLPHLFCEYTCMASNLLQGHGGPRALPGGQEGWGPHSADLTVEQGSSLGTQKGPLPGRGGWPPGVRE